ncbi:hypothetical protein NQ314_009133 [Rhamnusium bicolor]|uniref:Peptidase S1 domain-containing protein n=1 Tax=Rhamnusium bicolor TaxID=1586634 RepID=A0AAV8Y3Y8_9CUCU|nr:hypothetical protein NQ314_009133 [Rhamnusium bicolor]
MTPGKSSDICIQFLYFSIKDLRIVNESDDASVVLVVCVCASTGDDGVCKISSNCPVVEQQAKRGIDPTLCGFYQLVTPIVCCPSDNFGSKPDPLTFPEDLPGTTIESNNNIRISEKKCEEYSKAVTETVIVLPLVTHTEPIRINVERCDYNSVPLIVGGEPASLGEFPFMAALGFNSEDQKWRCGATLISDRYVLTAAHCTFTRDAGSPKIIRLGDLDLTSNHDGSEHKDYDVAKVIVHPDYKYPHKYNDIALIQTTERIIFTKFIRPACLYTKEEILLSSGVATGWGRTDFAGENSDKLRKVTLNIYERDKCAKTYQQNKDLPLGITSNMLCAGELRGRQRYMSGGPLLITKVGNQCKFYVIGITSFGKSCGQQNTPAVYTKVSEYVDWIEQNIW